jgi:ABC-type multidrug transport system fused ATPase/permease subunit
MRPGGAADQLLAEHPSSFFPPGSPDGRVDRRQALQLAMQGHDLEALATPLDTAGGPRQARLAGARAQREARLSVRDPGLLIVDDLSSAFDEETDHTLWEHCLARPEA